jgi:hypothetical protein
MTAPTTCTEYGWLEAAYEEDFCAKGHRVYLDLECPDHEPGQPLTAQEYEADRGCSG